MAGRDFAQKGSLDITAIFIKKKNVSTAAITAKLSFFANISKTAGDNMWEVPYTRCLLGQ